MSDLRVIFHLSSEIGKLRDGQLQFLGNGGAKDFAEYRHVCGVIRGLAHAEQLVNDLVQRMETSDNE